MKKFYSFLVAAVLLMGATSCQKEATAEAGIADNVEFVASIAGGRTELGDGNQVMWNDGDNIRIYTQENLAGSIFVSDAVEAVASATFTLDEYESFTDSQNGYLALYPENVKTAKATFADGVYNIPVNITGWNQTGSVTYPFAFERNNIMLAFSQNKQLSFQATMAVLKITSQSKGWWGSVKFYGANLGGAATLHYDTTNAENPISYTLTPAEESLLEYDFNDMGETIYLPIYPGTVTGFEVYEGNDTLIAKYENEFTFKAGVIYNFDFENAPSVGGGNNSPYSLFNGMEFIPMTIENGYHVAKNVPFAEWGYWISEGQSTFYEVSGNITMGTWMELVQGMNTGIIFEAENADFYMAEDASMLCIVPAGTPAEQIPALPVKTVSPWVLSTGMKDVTMYVDDNGYHYAKNVPAGSWWIFPENRETMHGLPVETPVEGTWYKTAAYPNESYSIWLEEPMNVYLSPEADFVCLLWPGMQLPELPEYEEITITAYNYSGWADDKVNVYAFSGATILSDTWPGTAMTATSEGVLTATLSVLKSAAPETIQFIFNNGSAQTADSQAFAYATEYTFYFTASTVLTEAPKMNAVKENCLYLKPNSNWTQVNAKFVALFCNGTKGDKWIPMTKVGDNGYYEVEIPGTTTEYKNVLFLRVDPSKTTYNWTNGSVWNQTDDLTWNANNNAYTVKEGTWSKGGGTWSKITEY